MWLSRTADRWDAPHFDDAVEALEPMVPKMVSYLNSNSRYRWKTHGGAMKASSLSYGEGASVSISAKVLRNEGGGL